jgi:hypothetical protein
LRDMRAGYRRSCIVLTSPSCTPHSWRSKEPQSTLLHCTLLSILRCAGGRWPLAVLSPLHLRGPAVHPPRGPMIAQFHCLQPQGRHQLEQVLSAAQHACDGHTFAFASTCHYEIQTGDIVQERKAYEARLTGTPQEALLGCCMRSDTHSAMLTNASCRSKVMSLVG